MLLNDEQKQVVRDLARKTIEYGVRHQQQLIEIDLKRYDTILQEPGACFVTLEKHGDLRGCIGSLEAHRALVLDVIANANAAAFSDPRFLPVEETELTELSITISVLSKAEPMVVGSEDDLYAQLQPGKDGLILEDGYHRATFLPSVWQQLPDSHDFLAHLKQKAGLSPDYWSNQIRFSRYHTDAF